MRHAIAGTSARFALPEVKLGVMPGIGGTQRLPRAVGRALAMDMALTGRMISAPEALAAGLVSRVTEDGDVLSTAIDAATAIAQASTPAVRAIRQAVDQAQDTPLPEGLAAERSVFHRLFGTPDQREGMQAFLEKRPARFHAD